MTVIIHPHARERMEERGATEIEVKTTIGQGEKFPAKSGRIGFRHSFAFEGKRNGKFFRFKRMEVYGVEEGSDFIVITVVVKYF